MGGWGGQMLTEEDDWVVMQQSDDGDDDDDDDDDEDCDSLASWVEACSVGEHRGGEAAPKQQAAPAAASSASRRRPIACSLELPSSLQAAGRRLDATGGGSGDGSDDALLSPHAAAQASSALPRVSPPYILS